MHREEITADTYVDQGRLACCSCVVYATAWSNYLGTTALVCSVANIQEV